MKKIIFGLLLAAVCVSSAFAGSKTKQQWLYGLPVDNKLYLSDSLSLYADATNFGVNISSPLIATGLWIPTQNKRYFSTDASFNGLRLAYEQLGSSVTSGTLRGLELRVSTQKDVGGAIRGAEIKAVQQNITGQSTVALLNGVYGNADGKDNIATIMRAFEASLDQEAGGTCTEAVAYEAFNNSSGAMTKSYAFSANGGTASGHKAYDADLRGQNGLWLVNDAAATWKFKDSSGNTLATITDAGSTGSVTSAGFVIGANTLDTNEFANLDGQDQAVKTTSSPSFVGVTGSTVTVTANFVLTGCIGSNLPVGKPVHSFFWKTGDNKIYRSTETTTGDWSWVTW